MVPLTAIQASNALIASSLSPQLVAVFVGATSGIGATTLKAFAKHAGLARIYLVGRNQGAADDLLSECKALNPTAEYIFIQSDVSLIRNVDDACREIKKKESAVNILFQTQGVLSFKRLKTPEGIDETFALTYYSRMRFIENLLPLLQAARSLRRVVTVFAGTKEGPLFADNDFQATKVSIIKIANMRGHMSSLIDLCLEALSATAPSVSFVHAYPGFVQTDLLNKQRGFIPAVIKGISKLLPSPNYIPLTECGERHLFLATSTRYRPARTDDNMTIGGVELPEGVSTARGLDGVTGSGVYAIDENGESAGVTVEDLLSEMRKAGMVKVVWDHTKSEFERITRNA